MMLLHYHPERGDDRGQQTPAPSHKEDRTEPEVPEVPSIESLTNDDDYDVSNDNDAVESTAVAANATSAAVACRWQWEAVIDEKFRLNPPPRTDVTTTINQRSSVPMMSLIDQPPEIDVDRRLNDRRSGNLGNDVTRVELDLCDDRCVSESFIDRHVVTGFAVDRPEVKITAGGSDCVDIAGVSGTSTHSAEVKAVASTELKIRSTFSKSVKRRRWSAETGSKRRLSIPRFAGQSKCTSMSALGNRQSTLENRSSALDQSTSGGSQVVDRVMAEKQRQAAAKERRVARTMAVIMAAFVFCWLPFFVIYVLFPFCGDVCSEAVGDRVVTFIVWLGYVNSTINPVIYTVFNVDFRRAFKSLLFRGRCYRRHATR